MTAKKADDLILSLAERVNKLACSQCGEVLQVADLEMLSETVCPSCQTRQPVPAKLKKFLLLEVLGTGGMASVYRAYDQSLGRMVAIKVMRREMGEDPTFVENFLREARSAAQLNHRNVVSIFTVDEVRGQPFIVMELLDGGRLDEMITQGQPIPEKRVLEIAHDVAEGLQAASQIGLIHGDVKPANILFNRAGQAKVADFGIARFQARKLSKGEIWGTPYYIAPEKVQGNKEDLRSDIYSLGGTLFHALSLLPPYDGPTATDVVLARLQRPPPNLNDLRSDLHPETVALISRMLEQDPFRRYPNYASLMSDLDAAMTAVARDPLPSSVHKKHPTPEGSGSRFPKWAYFAAGAAGLVAIGAALLILRKSPPPPQEPSVEPPAAVVEPTPAPTPTTEPDPAPTPMLPLQPFSVEDQKFLVEVGALLAEGKTENSDTKLLEFARATRDHPGRVWIPVFMALPVWMDLDSTQTVSRLKRLVEFAYEPQADGSVHPGLLAQAFGRVMIGASETLPPPAEGQAWPGWATDLFQFFEAVQGLRKGEPMPKVSEKLGVYLDAAASEEIAWPYALQPLARNWKKRIDDWEEQRSKRSARLERGGQGLSILKSLEDLRPKTVPLLATYLEKEILEVQPIADQERKAAERAAAQVKLQSELDKLDEIRAQAYPFIQRNDFVGAADLLQKASTDFQVEEARQLLQATREGFLSLQKMKLFLSQSFRSNPFRQGARELGGTVISGSAETLVIQLASGVGQTERTWAQVQPQTLVQMAEQYISAAQMNPREKADLWTAASFFLYVHGGFPRAAAFAQQAVAANPEQAPQIRRLMPGMLSE